MNRLDDPAGTAGDLHGITKARLGTARRDGGRDGGGPGADTDGGGDAARIDG